jgi:hypothetical protein
MWIELGFSTEGDLSHPPRLAHERVADRMPGLAEASKALAERARTASFGAITAEGVRGDLDLQRFLRGVNASEANLVEPYLPLMANFDLHRRKTFWVEPALAFMLENTDADVAGEELRCPFPFFAIALTDRHSLSLGERVLSRRREDLHCGQILRVMTAYVAEQDSNVGRTLSITFAFDSLGADLPSLLRREVPAGSAVSLLGYLEGLSKDAAMSNTLAASAPLRALLRLVINAILYATSAGVEGKLRPPPERLQPHKASSPSSDSVYFLPGHIDIRQVRRLQDLQRAPQGRDLMARFMVRGHWRRPAKGWRDQSLRWIEPYWKGPDMAAIIEKAYRLKS